MEEDRPTILTFVDYYLPGMKAGGPMRSVSNIVDWLGDECRFRVVTRDRDEGDTEPYESVRIGEWNTVGKAEVLYLPQSDMSLARMAQVMRSSACDAVYANSFFSPYSTIKPLLLRRLRRIPETPFIVAPRGEFSPGALAIKRRKKLAYIACARAVGLYRGVVWQASTEHEEKDIRRWWGKRARVVVAPNLPSRVYETDDAPRHEKRPGSLKVVFLSRVSRKKNLLGAIRAFAGIRGDVEFSVYGPLEDRDYWNECHQAIDQLPANVRVAHKGPVEHEAVAGVMREHDLFFLPTFGENFGHVILEALLGGCPVLVSDQTPWLGLERLGAGWDVPLSESDEFTRVIQQCVDMDGPTHAGWSRSARELGLARAADQDAVEANRRLFTGLGDCAGHGCVYPSRNGNS